MKAKPLPAKEELLACFYNNPETGEFYRKSDGYKGLLNSGYMSIWYRGTFYLIHRLIYKMEKDEEPEQVDHRDGNKLNNKLSNLRGVNNKINQRNQSKYKNNTSGYTGVKKNGTNWQAYITLDNKRINLGMFTTPEYANEARIEYIRNHPELGFTERHINS